MDTKVLIHLVDAILETVGPMEVLLLKRIKSKNMLRQVEEGDVNQPQNIYPDSEGESSLRKNLNFSLEFILMLISKPHICREIKSSNILFDDTAENYQAETPNKYMLMVNSIDSGGSTSLDISSDPPQSGETDMEIKKDEAQKLFKFCCRPFHLQNIWPNMRTENKSQINNYHVLLLIAALLSTITLLTAVKILGCSSEESYEHNSLRNPICLIMNQHPYIIRLVLIFNSIAFFLSTALMIILFNELSLRPLLLVSAFSMLGNLDP